ncbi:MAG: hypothetical protein VKJ64_18055, partial [Leptolyngbyaceae bacterium]|nr:hypothetical protein [Leptolyngbyaceae bacterium]
ASVTTLVPALAPPETTGVQFSAAIAQPLPTPESAAPLPAVAVSESQDLATFTPPGPLPPAAPSSPAEAYAQSVDRVLQVVNGSSPEVLTDSATELGANSLNSANSNGWHTPDINCEESVANGANPSPQVDGIGAAIAPLPAATCVAQVDILVVPPATDGPVTGEYDSHSIPPHPIPPHQLHPGIPPGVPIYRVPEDQQIQELLEESEADFIPEAEPSVDSPTLNITNAGAERDDDLSPLERQPTRLFNLETANQLADNALQMSAGFHQTLSNDSPAPATGGQLYYGSIDWGITDDWQIGLAGQYFDDPPPSAIDGEFPNITLFSIAPNVKYRVLDQEQFDLGVQGSVELFSVDSSLYDTDGAEAQVVGSLHVPMTYEVGSEVQLHLTPGVAFFPDSINGNDFYGTVFSVGTGVSWQPSERLLFYGTLNLPLGPGGNAISTDDQDMEQQLVWTVGSRYNVTPKVGVDLYASNGLGVTPATGVLAFLPEGEDAVVGLKLNYTPDLSVGYRSSFRDGASEDLTERDRQLLLDGFTLSTPHTVQPGSVLISTGGGTNERYYGSVAYSPDEDFQIEGLIEEFSSPNNIITENEAGDNVKYAVGAQLRLLNQQQGDPFSLGVRLLGGRDTDDDRQIGTLFADLPMAYDVSDRTTLFANPRLAAFSEDEVFGIGVGVNHEVLDGLQLVGEVTPVIDETVVWAAGARYTVPKTGLSLDLYASNAAGRNGLGTLVGESDTNVGFNLNWLMGG